MHLSELDKILILVSRVKLPEYCENLRDLQQRFWFGNKVQSAEAKYNISWEHWLRLIILWPNEAFCLTLTQMGDINQVA